ncbi:uncharacterized protein LOC143253219 isoform X8 [Tachypleus tridentatus]|uniref:uncharacterized protein LOC143253219 isoform X8 n=1 Tax=Tachypleus tridentatus TaxID=6853 RepID=UPI003FD0A6D4
MLLLVRFSFPGFHWWYYCCWYLVRFADIYDNYRYYPQKQLPCPTLHSRLYDYFWVFRCCRRLDRYHPSSHGEKGQKKNSSIYSQIHSGFFSLHHSTLQSHIGLSVQPTEGCVWLYHTYEPEYEDKSSPDYCHKSLYLFAFFFQSILFMFICLLILLEMVFRFIKFYRLFKNQ